VVTLKNKVPADWITAARQAARPAPSMFLVALASHVWIAPPSVNRSEPRKKVNASSLGPTSAR
jgi:hypothetical protein